MAYEIRKPLIVGSPRHVAAEAKKIRKVDAHCVARFVMTPEKYAELVDLLVRHRDNFVGVSSSGDMMGVHYESDRDGEDSGD